MFRIIIALVWLALAFPCHAQMTTLGAGGTTKAAAAGYTGPGDVVSSAGGWWGLRGYTAAYATPGTNHAVDLVDQAGANPITINILSNGTLDVASIATWVTAHSVTTIKVSQLYDQSGNSHNLTQGTLASMPSLVLGPVTGLASNRPTMTFSGSQFLLYGAPVTQAQPLTLSAASKRTSGTTTAAMLGGNTTNDAEIFFDTANKAGVFAGTALIDTSQTDNAWHAFLGIANGSSSLMNVDGASGTPGNAGSVGFSGGSGPVLGKDSFSQFMTGNVVEAGMWPSALSGANMSSLSSNQHSYWGF